jgi:hypothetical protein
MKTIFLFQSGLINRQFARHRFLVLTMCALCALCVESAAHQWRTITPGIEHAEVRREFSEKPVDIDLLRLDLKKVRIDVKHANDAAKGTETTSSIAKRSKAIAAINAGFFRLDASPFAGDPVGLFMIDGTPLSEAFGERIQLIINNSAIRTDVRFARSKVIQSVTIGKEVFELVGINRERKADDIVIYTPEFGPTTQTNADGVEIVVVKGVITALAEAVGNTAIPRNGFVVSVAGTRKDAILVAVKDSATMSLVRKWEGLPEEFQKDRTRLDIVTGVPQLVRGGAVEITWELEKSNRAFVETRHPRTAVARLKDGNFLFLTADGRTEQSAGLGLEDLAKYFVELGAIEAINLDGGGSTTMFVDGKIVNRPSDKEGERKVSDALVVTSRKRR